MLGGKILQLPHFPDVMSERLFGVDVLVALQGHRGGVEMLVIGGADDDRLDVFLLVVHHAEIGVLGDVGIAVEDAARAVGIDVAQRDDVLIADDLLPGVAAALPAAADNGDVEALVGPAAGLCGERFGDPAGQPESRRGRGNAARLQQLAATDFPLHEWLLGEYRNANASTRF